MGLLAHKPGKRPFDNSTLTPALPVVEEVSEVADPVIPVSGTDYPGSAFSYNAFVPLQFDSQVQKFQQRVAGFGV